MAQSPSSQERGVSRSQSGTNRLNLSFQYANSIPVDPHFVIRASEVDPVGTEPVNDNGTLYGIN